MSPIRVNARARRRIGPFIVNAGARSGVSLSLKLGRVTVPVEVGLLRACDPQRGGCGAEPGDVCRTPTKRPAARMHKARRTPDPIPEPTRPLAFRIAFGIGKVLGILVLAFPLPALVVAVVAVATVWIRLS
jgi:hypothetical protein